MDMNEKIATIQLAMYMKYVEIVREWEKRNNVSFSEHSRNITAKILAHRDGAYTHPPSSFIQHFLDNNFRGVMNSMDDDIRHHLFNIYRAWYNIDSYHIKEDFDKSVYQYAS